MKLDNPASRSEVATTKASDIVSAVDLSCVLHDFPSPLMLLPRPSLARQRKKIYGFETFPVVSFTKPPSPSSPLRCTGCFHSRRVAALSAEQHLPIAGPGLEASVPDARARFVGSSVLSPQASTTPKVPGVVHINRPKTVGVF
jgi:hypothetical protein